MNFDSFYIEFLQLFFLALMCSTVVAAEQKDVKVSE